MLKKKSLLTLTKAATIQIVKIVKNSKNAIGIHLSLGTRGCSGLSYCLEYVTQKSNLQQCEKIFIDKSVILFIDFKAVMFVLGSKMDYKESNLHSGFIFINPNEKGRCGCGDSFHV